MNWRARILLLVLACAGALPQARGMSADEVEQQRLIAISTSLHCLVCQGESLSGSRAGLAEDLRREIRTMIRQGKSNQEIRDILLSRYGDFVRYEGTARVPGYWWGLGVLLLVTAAAGVIYVRRGKHWKGRAIFRGWI